jgi:Ferritin-like domain
MTHITCGERAHGPPESGTSFTRASMVKRVAVVGGTALATGAMATLVDGASSAAVTARDVRILNYVLRLEELKAAFYEEAAGTGALVGELQQLAETLARHERAHIALLRKRLGAKAADERTYDFGSATRNSDTFASTTRALEETAVAAYIGQGANLSRSLMTPFAELCSVEARHAAWIADVLERDPAPRPADDAKPPAEVIAAIQQLGFERTS